MTSSPPLVPPVDDSADAALFAMLGIDKIYLDVDTEDEESLPDDNNSSAVYSIVSPPASCHRPNTPHDPLLLLTSPLFSLQQCEYILSVGYKASNDGGLHHGPRYITTARNGSDGGLVQLLKPNHHKVCVFKNAVVLKWLTGVLREHLTPELSAWWVRTNNADGVDHDGEPDYIVNPRLRLLRYDACDKDEFLPHYDATTTCTQDDGTEYESKLTILLYLNTCGTAFVGGETLFLNSLQPEDHLVVTPERGKMVIFNHELYHSSQQLVYDESISVDDGKDADGFIIGGSKFVLRSDVMFKK